MPRSVAHDVQGGELRVWRTKDSWLHAKLAATREQAGVPYDVDARWDIPPKAARWSEIAGKARDGDEGAAEELAEAMRGVFLDPDRSPLFSWPQAIYDLLSGPRPVPPRCGSSMCRLQVNASSCVYA